MNRHSILITSPSLDVKENVSGISSLVSDIIGSSKFRFIHFRLGSRDKEKKNIVWAFKQFFIYIKAIYVSLFSRFEIVHLNLGLEKFSIIRDYFMTIIMKKIFRKKLLLHIHGGFYLMNAPCGRLFSSMLKTLFKNADAIVVLSEMEKQILTKRYGSLEFYVLPNAVNTSIANDLSREQKEDKIKFIFIGRINRSKGVYIISEAFRQLHMYYDKFSFEIYGSGPELENWLQELDSCKGLRYNYNGVVGGIEKWKALYNADVFLLPSLHSEGMPIALIEAMSAGCVVMVTDDASITTVVKNGENGMVINKNDPRALAAGIRKILDGELDTKALSSKAHEYVYANLSIAGYTSRLDQLYAKLN